VASPTRGSPELDLTLRKMAGGFRVLGWMWMLLLVVTTAVTGSAANRTVMWSAVAVATIWTLVTIWVASLHPRVFGSGGFFLADGAVCLGVGGASTLADAAELFHGGFPMSWVLIGAYVGGMRLALVSAVALAIEQAVLHEVMGLGAIRSAGSVIFVVFALLAGWTYDRLRSYDVARSNAQARLAVEQVAVARHEERATLAGRLHDSVLQTLHAITMDAEDVSHVRYLARRQERELRQAIDELESVHARSFRAALMAAVADVEDLYPFDVDAVIHHDAELGDGLIAVVEAAREALTNAAKHSGASNAHLFVQFDGSHVEVYVRDRGCGIRSGTGEHGIAVMRRRLAAVGGSVDIRSEDGRGTEVTIVSGNGP
jgi:signal transduction histidine kinase